MEKFELNSFLDNNLFCPKCGKQVIQDNEMFDASKICKHVMFVAHDEGFEFSKNEEIVSTFEEDEESDDSLDEYLSKLDVKNGLLITKYATAPYFFGSYVGFDFSEN